MQVKDDVREGQSVGYLLHRLYSKDQAPSGYDMLKIATTGSAKVMGRDDIGSLEVGKAGDFFFIDTRHLELVGADLDPKSLLGTVGYKMPEYKDMEGKMRSVWQQQQLTSYCLYGSKRNSSLSVSSRY